MQRTTPPGGSQVVIAAPLDAADAAKITQAAQAAHETPADYVAKVLAKPAG
jgi:hypothetical protein